MHRGHFSTFQQATHRAKKSPRTNIYMPSFNYTFPVILESVVSLVHFVPGVIFSEISNAQVLKSLGVGRSSADVSNSHADTPDPFPRL